MTEIEALTVAIARMMPEDAAATKVLAERLGRLEESARLAARPYTHKLVGMRYYQPYEDEFQSLEEAVGQAYWAVEDNHFAPTRSLTWRAL